MKMKFDALVNNILNEGSLEGTIHSNTYHVITVMFNDVPERAHRYATGHQIRSDALIELPVENIKQAAEYVANNLPEIYEKTPRLHWGRYNGKLDLYVDNTFDAEGHESFMPFEPEFIDEPNQVASIPLDDDGTNVIVISPNSKFFGKPIAAMNFFEWRIAHDPDFSHELADKHGEDEKHFKKDWSAPIWQSPIHPKRSYNHAPTPEEWEQWENEDSI